MPVSTFSEVATVAEEVATTGETVGAVDLLTVSQQLDRLEELLEAIHFGQMVFVGVLLGVGIILVLAVMFRG